MRQGELVTYKHRQCEFPPPSDNAPFEPQRLQDFEEVGADPHMRDVVEDNYQDKSDKAAFNHVFHDGPAQIDMTSGLFQSTISSDIFFL